MCVGVGVCGWERVVCVGVGVCEWERVVCVKVCVDGREWCVLRCVWMGESGVC